MTITRVFRVTIEPTLRAEFEHKFSTLSQHLFERAPGCLSQSILRPTRWTPDEYAMVSEWESETALASFVGERWCEAVIPAEMEHFAKAYSVSHYSSWGSSGA